MSGVHSLVFLALARTLSLTPIAPAKASSVLSPLICLVRSRKPSRNCILYSAISTVPFIVKHFVFQPEK